MIAEYQLTDRGDGKFSAPSWIVSGGFIPNPVNNTLMGFYTGVIPDGTVLLTVTQAKVRAVTIHDLVQMRNVDTDELLSDAEVETMVQNIIDKNDQS